MMNRSKNYFTIPYQYINVNFPGTGDIFSAILTGDLLAGYSLENAVNNSVKMMERIVSMECNEVEKNKGIRIEQYLDLIDN